MTGSGPVTNSDRLDYLAAGWRPWLLLVLLSLSLFVPGLVNMPPVDRDEARFVQATRQMLESGDFIRIRYQDEARNKKPVGIYWLQALTVGSLSSAESDAIWPYRLVSLIGALAAVLLCFHFGAILFDARTALVAAGLLTACLDLVVEAHLATTDAMLLATAMAAQGALAQAYLASRRGETLPISAALLFWFAQGLALLLKGPVVPLISGLTAITLWAWDRRARWFLALRPAWGLPLALAMVLPWLVLIERATDGAFLSEAIGHDLLGKVAGAQEAHGAPPGYYLTLLPVSFWPGSLFLGGAALWAWRSRRLPAARLLIAWAVPSWILFEFVPTKLPHYVLPLYPALALASARAALALGEEGMSLPRWAARLFPWLWAFVAVLLGGILVILPPALGSAALPGGAVAAAAALAGTWQVLRHDRLRLGVGSVATAILVSVLVLVPGFAAVLPAVNAIWLSRSAAGLVAAERAPGAVVSATGYNEPSLVFSLGTNTRLLSAEAAAVGLAGGEVALSLVASGNEAAFRTTLADLKQVPRALGQVNGFDYSNGKWLTLTLYRVEKQP